MYQETHSWNQWSNSVWKGSLEVIPSNPSHTKDNSKVRSSCSGPCLMISLEGDVTAALGILCQCWTALTLKNPSHYNCLELSLLHLASVGLIPFAVHLEKTLALPLLFPAIRKLKSAIWCPPPWPSLLKSEHEQVSASGSIILQFLLARAAPVSQHLPCTAGQKGPLLVLQMRVKFTFALFLSCI